MELQLVATVVAAVSGYFADMLLWLIVTHKAFISKSLFLFVFLIYECGKLLEKDLEKSCFGLHILSNEPRFRIWQCFCQKAHNNDGA